MRIRQLCSSSSSLGDWPKDPLTEWGLDWDGFYNSITHCNPFICTFFSLWSNIHGSPSLCLPRWKLLLILAPNFFHLRDHKRVCFWLFFPRKVIIHMYKYSLSCSFIKFICWCLIEFGSNLWSFHRDNHGVCKLASASPVCHCLGPLTAPLTGVDKWMKGMRVLALFGTQGKHFQFLTIYYDVWYSFFL